MHLNPSSQTKIFLKVTPDINLKCCFTVEAVSIVAWWVGVVGHSRTILTLEHQMASTPVARGAAREGGSLHALEDIS